MNRETYGLWLSILPVLITGIFNWLVLRPDCFVKKFVQSPEKVFASAKELFRLVAIVLYLISLCAYFCSLVGLFLLGEETAVLILLLSVFVGLMAPIAAIVANNLRN